MPLTENNSSHPSKQNPHIEIEGNVTPDIKFKFDKVFKPKGIIVSIGGRGGGLHGPANIYEDLAVNVNKLSLSLLRIDIGKIKPHHIKAALYVKMVLFQLRKELENTPMLLMGWSMGGASIIHVAKWVQDNLTIFGEAELKGLITLASQNIGTGPVKELKNIPMYILHGTNDTILRPGCSKSIFKRANEPKELVLLEGASHKMEESFDKLKEHVYYWIIKSFDIKQWFTCNAKIAVRDRRLLDPIKLQSTLCHEIGHVLGVRGHFRKDGSQDMMEKASGARMKSNDFNWVFGERTIQLFRDHYNSTTPNTPARQRDLENVRFIGWDTNRIKKIYFKVQEDFNSTTRENVDLLTDALQECLDKLNQVIGKQFLFVKDEKNFHEEDEAKPWWRKNYGEVPIRIEAMEGKWGYTVPSVLKSQKLVDPTSVY